MSDVKERLSREQIKGKLISILSDVSGIDDENIQESMDFYDLKLDSLDLANVDISMEDEFGFNLDDFYHHHIISNLSLVRRLSNQNFYSSMEGVATVGNVVDYIHGMYNSV